MAVFRTIQTIEDGFGHIPTVSVTARRTIFNVVVGVFEHPVINFRQSFFIGCQQRLKGVTSVLVGPVVQAGAPPIIQTFVDGCLHIGT